MAANAHGTNFADWLACYNLINAWAESYDSKNFQNLANIFTPIINLDYSGLPGHASAMVNPEAKIETLINHMSPRLGKPGLATLHQVSNVTITFSSETEGKARSYIVGRHCRNKQEANGYGPIDHMFKKVDGKWYICGLRPNKPYWIRGDFIGVVVNEEMPKESIAGL